MSSQAQPHHLALDAQALREAVEAHQRYLGGRSGGRRLSLTYADLSNCTLEGLDLREADFAGANFHGATLARANLTRGILFGADLREADLRRANLTKADLRGACLRGANLAGAELPGCDLREGRIALQDKLDGFRILRHEHRPGELNYAILSGANLSGAQMTGAVAMSSDFTDANLSGAQMAGAKLTRAVLDGADLTGADLAGADLSGASMKRAVLNGANLQNTIFDNVDLSDVLRAPPAVTFVADRPLDQVLADHEAYCDSGGQRGAVVDLSKVDFRSLRTLKERRCTALVARGAVFFGLDLQRRPVRRRPPRLRSARRRHAWRKADRGLLHPRGHARRQARSADHRRRPLRPHRFHAGHPARRRPARRARAPRPLPGSRHDRRQPERLRPDGRRARGLRTQRFSISQPMSSQIQLARMVRWQPQASAS
jgi:uncharacterized protein YjbI with pentapeptide repeats